MAAISEAKLASHLMKIQPRKRIVELLVLIVLAVLGEIAQCQTSQPAPPVASDSAENHLGRGYDALKQDQYEKAAAEFRAALKLDPKLVLRARFPLAVALFEMHKSEDARREFEAVRRDAGDNPNISYYLGRIDLEDMKFEAAVHDFTQAATKPPFSDTSYYLGYAYFKNGDLLSAEKWLNEAARAAPQDSRVPYQLGLVYRALGREEEAKKAMALSGELRQRDNSEATLRTECGQKLDQAPRSEAQAVCEQLYDPENADKLTQLGTIYGQHGDLQDALKPFRRAAELAPQSPQTQYNLALTYYQLGRFQDARTPLAAAVLRWPDLFQLNALYGAVLVKLGENSAAYPLLRHALELNPQDRATTELLYGTALALGDRSESDTQYPEALSYFAEASAVLPVEPAPHRRMAETYAHMGRTADAAAEQQEADRLTKRLMKPGG